MTKPILNLIYTLPGKHSGCISLWRLVCTWMVMIWFVPYSHSQKLSLDLGRTHPSEIEFFRLTDKGKLPGFQFLSKRNETLFTNPIPGIPSFEYYIEFYPGIWSKLVITIPSAFFFLGLSWWAFLLLGLIVLGFFYLTFLSGLKPRPPKAKYLNPEELDSAKAKLYTTIIDEFRTPLSIIRSVSERIFYTSEKAGIATISEDARILKQNCSQLLILINQILDLGKLEAGKLPVNLVREDIVLFFKHILDSIKLFAEASGVRLHFSIKEKGLIVPFDPVKIRHIVSNLLLQVIKYRPEGGEMKVMVKRSSLRGSQECLQITVKETSTGIVDDKLQYIFNDYGQDEELLHQIEKENIGLTLTKALIRLLKGEIKVKNDPEKGITFVLYFPLQNSLGLVENAPARTWTQQIVPPGIKVESPIPSVLKKVSNNRPLVLLIAGNKEIIYEVRPCLKSIYQVVLTFNGREGIDKAIKLIPDLIICDVMVPEQNGLEVTKTLKNDPRTSHIPIILLTPKSDIHARLLVLERGADVYLPKPFNKEELVIRCQKLLELRQKLQQHYLAMTGHQGVIMEPEVFSSEKQEDAFVLNVRQVVQHHLSDFDFSVEQLAREVMVSRSQLHRKLSALTGYSATRFIRFIRLNKAKELLQNTKLPIGAVAYESGFSDPVYFTRVFRQEFGMTPSEWKEKQ